MRLSFYTYSYTDRLEMPIEMCLKRIANAGYSGIDVSGTNGRSEDPKSFDNDRRRLTRETAGQLDLRVEAVITHAPLTDTLVDPRRKPLDLKGTIDLAQALGSKVVTFHMGGYHEGVPRDAVWGKAVRAIREAAEYGIARHVDVAVDGIWPEWIDDSPEALARLLDDVGADNFGVNFDPCYLTLIGIDPVQFARRFRDHIKHGHLKDHQGKYPEWTHRLPGQGEMNYQRVFRALANLRFTESVAVECFTDMKFERACDECFVALRDAAAAVSVEFSK